MLEVSNFSFALLSKFASLTNIPIIVTFKKLIILPFSSKLALTNMENDQHGKCTEQAERCSGNFFGLCKFWVLTYAFFFLVNGKNFIQYALPSCEG